ncbi:MAG: DUF2798 domain-containing protein [Neptuniibacter sp.]
MSLVISFVFTLINTGFTQQFILIWANDFLLNSAIAFPAALIIAPIAKIGATKLTQPTHFH